ncbi:MAG: NUDIX hydrolase [Mycobacteriales bacterium]|nr:NUDIX hydrolase [Frankia sp.]
MGSPERDVESLRALPPDFVDRARAFAAGTLRAVEPRHAATVVLLRDAPTHGVEVHLLRRVASMAFAPGMYVFPGGSVDPRDADRHAAWAGPEPAAWTGALDADEPLARALVCAAVRETFEEAGVLLAGRDAQHVVVTDPSEWEARRQALLDRSVSLSELLEGEGLVLRADLLRPWAHWVTPEIEPRRYDTRFFVAALPPGQDVWDVAGESDRGSWVSPADALERQVSGDMAMLPPTAFTLAELAEFGRVADVLAAADAREVRRVLPKIVVTGEQVELLMPGDVGYPLGANET